MDGHIGFWVLLGLLLLLFIALLGVWVALVRQRVKPAVLAEYRRMFRRPAQLLVLGVVLLVVANSGAQLESVDLLPLLGGEEL